MPTSEVRRPRLVLSTVSSDSHTWNLIYLQLLLEENGYDVTNLGACVPDELLAATVSEQRPDAIVVSSVNGHGCLDGARMIRAVRRDARSAAIPAVIGGKLGIAGEGDRAQLGRLRAAGFDAVFGDDDPQVLLDTLTQLTGARASQSPELELAV